MTKQCNRCKEIKDISQYNRKGKRVDGSPKISGLCKICTRKSCSASYFKRREYYIAKSVEKAQRKRRENAIHVQTIKHNKGCKICGERDPRCLDFHHPNKDKVDCVANLAKIGSYNIMLVEIAKCEVMCSNCHRKEHFKLRIDLQGVG